jgi:sporulation protein YunB
MDSIYSRKKIRIPKVEGFYSNNKNGKKIIKVISILLIAVCTFYIIIKSMSPIFDGLCVEKVKNIGTIIMNEETNNVLNNTDYSKIVTVTKDENNTNIVKTDVVQINKIASDIAIKIEERFKNVSDEKIQMPIGAVTGSKYLSGIGPNIKISVIPTGNVLTELKTEFKAQGINQTVYRIYLELTSNVSILTPYKSIDETIVNQVLLVETVIVGNVPETYYNLEGINTNDAVDIIN